MTSNFQRRLFAEFTGTYILLLGVFAVIGARSRSLFDDVALDLGRYGTLGLLLFITVSYFDSTSAHFNPAVSLSHAIAKKLSWRDFAAYSAVQTIASLLAAITATVLAGGPTRRVLPNAARVSSPRAFLYEFGAALLLVGVYFATENQLRSLRGPLVGAAAICAALTIGRFTTLGLNPARSLGPALWNRFGSTTWIFLLAPLVGGAVAGFVARFAPLIQASPKSSSAFSIAINGFGEFAGTFLTFFLGLAGIRAVGGVIGIGIYFLGPPVLLFLVALLLRSQTFFNPAITLAMLLARRLNPLNALVFIGAQIAGAILAVQALRAWLQGDARLLLQIVPVDRISTVRLFVLEALCGAILIGMALRTNNPIAKPAVVALTTFALAASLGGFGKANTNLAWAIGTASGWTLTTATHHLVWLIGGPLLSAVIIGLVARASSTIQIPKDANSSLGSASPS